MPEYGNEIDPDEEYDKEERKALEDSWDVTEEKNEENTEENIKENDQKGAKGNVKIAEIRENIIKNAGSKFLRYTDETIDELIQLYEKIGTFKGVKNYLKK